MIFVELNDMEALELQLTENIQREDYTPIEEARGFSRLVNEFDLSHKEVGKIIGKSRVYITNIIRLLNLPPEVQKQIDEGRISKGHAIQLLSLKDKSHQKNVADMIIEKDYNVKETVTLVKRMNRIIHGHAKDVSRETYEEKDTYAERKMRTKLRKELLEINEKTYSDITHDDLRMMMRKMTTEELKITCECTELTLKTSQFPYSLL